MFFKVLKKRVIFLIVVLLFSSLLGYFVCDFFYNDNFSYYEYELKLDNYDEYYFSNDFYKEQENKILTYNKYVSDNPDLKLKTIYYSTQTNYQVLYNNLKIEKIDDTKVILKLKKKTFDDTFASKSQKLNEGKEKAYKTFKAIYDNGITYKNSQNEEIIINVNSINVDKDNGLVNRINPYIAMAIVGISLELITILVIFILYKKNKLKDDDFKYDNIEYFKTPFHKQYWIESKNFINKISKLATIATLFALMFAAKAIKLPTGFGSLGLSFSFLFFAAISMLYGPLCGISIGFISDILGFFVFPTGMPFHFGYTIDAMHAGFIYGIFFFKTKITFRRAFYSRLYVNIIVNVICGSIWWSQLNNFTIDAFFNYMFLISLPKNLIYLIPQTVVLYFVLKAVERIKKPFMKDEYKDIEEIDEIEEVK